ncbi:hypothetical protein QYE76_023060 [Lolium multiflorum]|uniref:Reverse transcriptase Ty1/copia-type domain-containing protein n=1 Tax=Lolium multiflorum TaxID=4521 RepID=A0AAD8R9H9_LOLMU|nr:hypothetical protein QYE76_023060 [Lolium multiflorum]
MPGQHRKCLRPRHVPESGKLAPDVSSSSASTTSSSASPLDCLDRVTAEFFYAYSVLAKPEYAFVPDVRLVLAKLWLHFVLDGSGIDFGIDQLHDCLDVSVTLLRTAATSTPAPAHDIDHGNTSRGFLDQGCSTHALGYLDIGTKGYHLASPHLFYSPSIRDATPSTTLPLWRSVSLGVHFGLSPSTVRATVVHIGFADRLRFRTIRPSPITAAACAMSFMSGTSGATSGVFSGANSSASPGLYRSTMAGSSAVTSVIPTSPISLANQITVRLTSENYIYWRTQAILSAIVCSLHESVLGTMTMVTTSHEAWETLACSFASQSTARAMAIRAELHKAKKLNKTASVFFNEIQSKADMLASIGQPLRPDEFTGYLCAGLDEQYDALVQLVSSRALTDPMPIRDVYAQLLNTEQRMEARRADLGADVHMAHLNYRGRGGPPPSAPTSPPYSKQPPPSSNQQRGQESMSRGNGGGGGSSGGGGRPICQICTKTGHVASCCFKRYNPNFLGAGNDGRYKDRQLAAFTSPTANNTSYGATPSYPIDPAWYADTAATDHFTNDLDKLTMREPYLGKDQVQTANGSGLGRGVRLELLDEHMEGASDCAQVHSADDRMHDDHVHSSSGGATQADDGPPTPSSGPTSPDVSSAPSPGSATSTTSSPASSSSPAPAPRPGVTTRLMRGIRHPKTRTDGTIAWHTARTDDLVHTEPRSHLDAMTCAHWRAAMEAEFSALQTNKTWQLVPPRPGVNIIDCKWVFKIKQKSDGTIERVLAPRIRPRPGASSSCCPASSSASSSQRSASSPTSMSREPPPQLQMEIDSDQPVPDYDDEAEFAEVIATLAVKPTSVEFIWKQSTSH